MILMNIPEITMYPVEDRGKANLERIPLLVNASIDVGCYGLMLGFSGPNNHSTPIKDHMLWLGDGALNQGDWIIVYTGEGEVRVENWNTPAGSKVYSVHWGKQTTIFANSNVVPILFKLASVNIGVQPFDVFQHSLAKA